MCLDCGFYKGRQVIDLAAKKAGRMARMQAKKEAISSQSESITPTEAEAVSDAEVVETAEQK